MKSLVVVESPTKARTISRFLGKDFDIKASMGHIMDLPKSTLGVDVENNFTPQYEVVEDKKQIIAELKKAAKKSDIVILATDPDREGEAIAYYVADILRGKKSIQSFKRIVFHEITNEAIQEALESPRTIDQNLVNAQTARRVLDRLVGYKLSPLLWQKVRRGLSAGRVQSIALRLIVEREREIEKFKKEEYWTVMALMHQVKSSKLTVQSEGTSFHLIEINGEKIESQNTFELYDGQYKVTKTSIANEQQAQEIVDDLKKRQFIIRDVLVKETKRSPAAPYTTSTMQQDASRRFSMSGKRAMRLAQKLYEEGYITYHRTDSVMLSQSAIQNIRGFVQKTYGDKYIPESPRFYTTKQKLAQEAHEAIRPTKFNVTEQQVTADLGRDFGRMYDLIWKRAIASQMSDALVESTTVIVDTVSSHPFSVVSSQKQVNQFSVGQSDKPITDNRKNTYRLKANGSVLLFEGFLKVNPQALQDTRLPKYTTGELLETDGILKEFHETPAPPRYNDASIIKTLEEKGIGRPSTYAMIISTIEDRQYVERKDARFLPTSVGAAVNDFLVKNFSDIDDIPFTASMEDELDAIAEGKRDWVPMMREFYTPLEKKLKIVQNAERVKIEVEEIDEKCPKCGSNLVIRIGKFGKFLACSTFPNCDFTKPYVEQTQFNCPKDRGIIVIKKTKKGRTFYGCSNYPKCNFAAWRLTDIKKAQEEKV